MRRKAACLLLMMTLAVPAQAQTPVVFLAREIIKSIVETFVKDKLISMLSTMGPCGLPLGPSGGLATLAGLLGGGGGLAGLPSMPGMPSLSALAGGAGMGSLQGIGAAGQIAGMAGGAAQLAGMQAGIEKMLREQTAQLPTADADGETGEAGEAGDAEVAAPPDIAQLTQEMQDATPLSSAEIDELGGLMERLSAAMPSRANPCKPGELTQVLHSTADVPMGSGMLRMMLQPMRDMGKSVAEAHDRFALMSDSESVEYVALMADEARGWDEENRKAFAGMVETNFLGMPQPMRAQLLARLRQRTK